MQRGGQGRTGQQKARGGHSCVTRAINGEVTMKVTRSNPELRLIPAAVAAILFASHAARAAESSPADTGAEAETANVAEVLVTATRREERLLDVPVSTS